MLFSRLTLAHLARWAAAIFLRPAADIVRLGLAAPVTCEVLRAQRVLCAAAIFARDFADILRRLRPGSSASYTLTNAVIAAFSADRCRCTPSRSFFNCFTIPDKFAIPSLTNGIVAEPETLREKRTFREEPKAGKRSRTSLCNHHHSRKRSHGPIHLRMPVILTADHQCLNFWRCWNRRRPRICEHMRSLRRSIGHQWIRQLSLSRYRFVTPLLARTRNAMILRQRNTFHRAPLLTA